MSDDLNRYTFYINPLRQEETFDAFFGFKHEGKDIFVTARDKKNYPLGVSNLNLENDLIIEVGSGLGNLLPELIKNGLKNKPVVIDFANYDLMREMLCFADTLSCGDSKVKIRNMIEHCDFYLGSEVLLYNDTLENVVKSNPHLRHSADYVIDNMGACEYFDEESVGGFSTKRLELDLLKQGGCLIAENTLSKYPR